VAALSVEEAVTSVVEAVTSKVLEAVASVEVDV